MPVTPPVNRLLGTTNKFIEDAAIKQPAIIPKYFSGFHAVKTSVSLIKNFSSLQIRGRL